MKLLTRNSVLWFRHRTITPKSCCAEEMKLGCGKALSAHWQGTEEDEGAQNTTLALSPHCNLSQAPCPCSCLICPCDCSFLLLVLLSPMVTRLGALSPFPSLPPASSPFILSTDETSLSTLELLPTGPLSTPELQLSSLPTIQS